MTTLILVCWVSWLPVWLVPVALPAATPPMAALPLPVGEVFTVRL
jgi:hypothetical protein